VGGSQKNKEMGRDKFNYLWPLLGIQPNPAFSPGNWFKEEGTGLSVL